MKKLSKNLKNIFIGSFIVSAFVIPFISFAQAINVSNQVMATSTSLWDQIQQEEGKYKFIVPFGPFASPDNMMTDLTTGDALINYLRTWFKFLIGVGGVIGVVRLVMVGFKIIMNAEKANARSEIRGEIQTVSISLLLIAGSWVFLNTINPTLVNSSLVIPKSTSTVGRLAIDEDPPGTPDADLKRGLKGPSYTFVVEDKVTNKPGNVGAYADMESCLLGLADFKKSMASSTQTLKVSDGCFDHTTYGMSPSEKTLRAGLATNHIFPNKGPCPTPTETSCTRIEGLGQPILASLVTLSSDCCNGQTSCTEAQLNNNDICPIVISGGTEMGHDSHGPNIPDVIDLRYTAKLKGFLEKNATIVTKSFDNNTRYLYKNYWYTDEIFNSKGKKTEHYHVCPQKEGKSLACTPIPEYILKNEKVCATSEDNPDQYHCYRR